MVWVATNPNLDTPLAGYTNLAPIPGLALGDSVLVYDVSVRVPLRLVRKHSSRFGGVGFYRSFHAETIDQSKYSLSFSNHILFFMLLVS